MPNNNIATAAVCLSVLVGVFVVISTCKGDTGESTVKLPIPVMKTRLSFTAFFLKIKIFFISLNRLIYYPVYRGIHEDFMHRAKALTDPEFTTVKVKTLYFIRHGESVFNDLTTNRNIIVIILKTIRLIIFEACLLFTNDFLTYDSPLSPEGISQSMNVAQFLSSPKNQNDPDILLLNGKSTVPTVLFTSYLRFARLTRRRAQGTMILLLQSRLTNNDENIFITHELDVGFAHAQEVVRNPDCVSMYTVFNYVTFPLLEQLFAPQSFYRYQRLRGVENDPYTVRAPYRKILGFFDRVFNKFDEDVVIATGHSRWIRYAMRIFFPPVSSRRAQNGVDADVLNKKLTNNGILKIDVHLKKNPAGEHFYMFDPKTFRIIYGAFK